MENNRKRIVNVENLSEDQLARVQKKIWERVQVIVDKAVKETNEILGIYNVACLMEVKIDTKENIQKIKEKR